MFQLMILIFLLSWLCTDGQSMNREKEEMPPLSSFEAHDGRKLNYCLWPSIDENALQLPRETLPPTLVLQFGKGGCIDEYRRQIEVIRDIYPTHRLASMDWPCQGFTPLSAPSIPIHIDHFNQYVTYFQEFIQRVIRDNRPLDMMGLSMGGNILMHYTHKNPTRVRSLILIAPMMGFPTFPLPEWGAYYLSSAICRLGYGYNYAFGQGNYNQEEYKKILLSRKNVDPEKVKALCDDLQTNHRQASSGVTWGWLHAALKASYQARGMTLPPVRLGVISFPDDDIIDARHHDRYFKGPNIPVIFHKNDQIPHDLFLANDDLMRSALMSMRILIHHDENERVNEKKAKL